MSDDYRADYNAYDEAAECLSWHRVDSRPSFLTRYAQDSWEAQREGQCVALNSRAERCNTLPVKDSIFCPRHTRGLVEDLTEVLEERAERRARRRNPEVFRWLVNAAREDDVARAIRDTNAVVYFLAIDDVVKIGFSTNAVSRVASLRSGGKTLMPEGYDIKQAVLLGTTPGGRNLEQRLHGWLSDHRIVGEWFVRSPEVNEAIAYFLEGAPAPLLEASLRELFGVSQLSDSA